MATGELHYKFDYPNTEERLRSLVLYIADKCKDDIEFGATMLNKILFYSDICLYVATGKPITGVEYMRLENGPVPRQMKRVLEDMIYEGLIERVKVKRYEGGDFFQHRTVAKQAPNLELYDAGQIDMVDKVIQELRGITARRISILSHKKPWELVSDKEGIPYEYGFLSHGAAAQKHTVRLDQLIRQHGWT